MNTDYQDVQNNNSEPALPAWLAVLDLRIGSDQVGRGTRRSEILVNTYPCVSVKICVPIK
jgi:hypothetical protein